MVLVACYDTMLGCMLLEFAELIFLVFVHYE